MRMLLTLENGVNRISDWLGALTALLFVLLLLNVFYNVIARFLFNEVSIGMQELEWHLHSSIFLLGIPYALRAGGHVRVDVLYERMSSSMRAWVDLVGTLVLLLPFCLLVVWYGVDFAREAYQLGETSGDPGGLSHRWIIKSMIPISFSFMALSGIGLLLTSVNTLLGAHEQPFQHTEL